MFSCNVQRAFRLLDKTAAGKHVLSDFMHTVNTPGAHAVLAAVTAINLLHMYSARPRHRELKAKVQPSVAIPEPMGQTKVSAATKGLTMFSCNVQNALSSIAAKAQTKQANSDIAHYLHDPEVLATLGGAGAGGVIGGVSGAFGKKKHIGRNALIGALVGGAGGYGGMHYGRHALLNYLAHSVTPPHAVGDAADGAGEALESASQGPGLLADWLAKKLTSPSSAETAASATMPK